MNLFTSLRYVAALHEHRHFGRAAQACYITQPALSNALRALEEEFGTAIVKRGRAFEGFTAEGELVYQAAQRILHEHALLKQELQSAADQPCGELRIGAVPSVTPMAARFATRLQARYPGIQPTLRAMSSPDIENGLENFSLDLGLGYMDRPVRRGLPLRMLAQYTERYFLLRRASSSQGSAAPTEPIKPAGQATAPALQFGPAVSWREAALLPLCLLTPEMHNRSIVNAAFAEAGAQVSPRMETDSVLALALSVLDGQLCSILPGALVGAVASFGQLQASPLVGPALETAIGLMVLDTDRPSRVLQAALAFAQDADWLQHAASHSGAPSA